MNFKQQKKQCHVFISWWGSRALMWQLMAQKPVSYWPWSPQMTMTSVTACVSWTRPGDLEAERPYIFFCFVCHSLIDTLLNSIQALICYTPLWLNAFNRIFLRGQKVTRLRCYFQFFFLFLYMDISGKLETLFFFLFFHFSNGSELGSLSNTQSRSNHVYSIDSVSWKALCLA